MYENHELMGGKLHLYRRENSLNWQCSTFLAGKNWRKSTKVDSFSLARTIAEDWYLELKGKMRSGELKFGKTFKDAAEKFLPEYKVITYGERSPKYVENVETDNSSTPPSLLRRQVPVRDHSWPSSRISHPSHDISRWTKRQVNLSDRRVPHFSTKSSSCGKC